MSFYPFFDGSGWSVEEKTAYPDLLEVLTRSKLERILDVGCGNGLFSRAMAARTGATIVGTDRCADALGQCSAHATDDVSFVDPSAVGSQEPFDAAVFSYVDCTQRSAEDRRSLLRSTLSCLRPGSIVAILNPNYPDVIGVDFKSFLAQWAEPGSDIYDGRAVSNRLTDSLGQTGIVQDFAWSSAGTCRLLEELGCRVTITRLTPACSGVSVRTGATVSVSAAYIVVGAIDPSS